MKNIQEEQLELLKVKLVDYLTQNGIPGNSFKTRFFIGRTPAIKLEFKKNSVKAGLVLIGKIPGASKPKTNSVNVSLAGSKDWANMFTGKPLLAEVHGSQQAANSAPIETAEMSFAKKISVEFGIPLMEITIEQGGVKLPFNQEVSDVTNLFTVTEVVEETLYIIVDETADSFSEVSKNPGKLAELRRNLAEQQATTRSQSLIGRVADIVGSFFAKQLDEEDGGETVSFRYAEFETALRLALEIHKNNIFVEIDEENKKVVCKKGLASDRENKHINDWRQKINACMKKANIFVIGSQPAENAAHVFARAAYLPGGVRLLFKSFETMEYCKKIMTEIGCEAENTSVQRDTGAGYVGGLVVKFPPIFSVENYLKGHETIMPSEDKVEPTVNQNEHQQSVPTFESLLQGSSLAHAISGVFTDLVSNTDFQDLIITELKKVCPEKIQGDEKKQLDSLVQKIREIESSSEAFDLPKIGKCIPITEVAKILE